MILKDLSNRDNVPNMFFETNKMEENNKGFIFISNDKEADTTIKIDYRSFVFFDVYGLENDKIYKIVDDLVYQFDLRAGKNIFLKKNVL